MENEIWKPVVGYEGLYEVSSLGQIRNIALNKVLKQFQRSKNTLHLSIGLSKGGKQKFYFVHDVVAKAFISNPHNYPIINHKDENPLNNRVENLEWCTYKYNSNYGTLPERRKRFVAKPILQYDKNGVFIKQWDSAFDVYHELGVCYSNIRKCIKGTRPYAGGFIWKCA